MVPKLYNGYDELKSEAKRCLLLGKGMKTSTPKRMFQRLWIALAQVKAVNRYGNLINEIRLIIYSLYCGEEIAEKVYNNIMNSVQS